MKEMRILEVTRQFLFFICFSILCVSCSVEDIIQFDEHDNMRKVVLSACLSDKTKVCDDKFENGDQIGLYMVDYKEDSPSNLMTNGNHADNIRFTYSNASGVWDSDVPIYWKGKKSKAIFYGYYPYTSNIENVKEYRHMISDDQTLPSSQTGLGGYELSDFLWTKTSALTSEDGKVDLQFSHLMSSIEVRVNKGQGFEQSEWENATKQVLVENTVVNSSIDLTCGNVKAVGTETTPVIACEYSDSFRAVLVPQTIPSGVSIITLLINDQTYSLIKNENVVLLQNKKHIFTITVDKRENTGDYSFVLAESTVAPWIDEGEFTDGITRAYTIISVPAPGKFSEVVSLQKINPSKVENLKVIGTINHDDCNFISENFQNLICVNFSEVRIKGNGLVNHNDIKVTSDGELNNLTYEQSFKDDVLPNYMFHGKSRLKKFIFPKRLKGIGENCFYACGLIGDIIIPEGVEFIGTWAFLNTYATGKLVLPSTLKYIGSAAFAFINYEPQGLSGELKLPESLIAIGGQAFSAGRSVGHKFSGSLVLPSRLSYLGDHAFSYCQFTGDLRIPGSLGIVSPAAFWHCSFDGYLILEEGVKQIKEEAFKECSFIGELVLPSTLLTIGESAFQETRFTNIVFNDKLLVIGSNAFNGTRISQLFIPKSVTAIMSESFANCSLLSDVILHKDVSLIQNNAFSGCHQLVHLTCEAETPPITDSDAFNNMPKDNLVVEVPSQSVSLYKNNAAWREFKRISPYTGFVCRPSAVSALNSMLSKELILNADGDWTVEYCPKWCRLSANSGSSKTPIMLTILDMPHGTAEHREDKIVFRLEDSGIITECHVSQYDFQYAENECVEIQKANKGNGSVSLIFVGDGYDAASITNGSYMNLVREQTEYFFDVFPYNELRDYFNVYALVTLSQESGINTTHTWRDTKFMTTYSNDQAAPLVDGDSVFDYIVANSPVKSHELSSSIVILLSNAPDYKAMTQLYENGRAISICPPTQRAYPQDMRGVVQHEACGHGFGKLADETIRYNLFAPSDALSQISQMHERGWGQNISSSGMYEEVPWADMIFDPRYSNEVDIYEGAYGYSRGVYRSESNSCMNYGIPYFNAVSRRDIVRRILTYAGEDYSDEYFYAIDSKDWGGVTKGNTHTLDGLPFFSSSSHHREPIIIRDNN